MSSNPLVPNNLKNSKTPFDDNEQEINHWRDISLNQSNYFCDATLHYELNLQHAEDNLVSVFT